MAAYFVFCRSLAMNKPERLTPRQRAALRAQGFQAREVWVPDLEDAGVRRKIHQACQRIAEASAREEDIAAAEALQYWPPEDRD